VEPHAERLFVLGPVDVAHPSSPDAAGRPELRDLFEEVDVGVEEEREPLRERVHVQPALPAEFDVRESVGERECQLLRGGRARLPDVVAGHADRMELRHLALAELDEVADEPQVRPRREQPLLLRDVLLEDVGLQRSLEGVPRDALPLGGGEEEREQHRGRPVDRHRRADPAEVDAAEERLEVRQRVRRHPAAADLALAARVVGVAAHQGRHVERDGEASLPLRQQELESRVRLLRRAEPGELPHRPQPAAVHRVIHAARHGEVARVSEIPPVVHVGHVLGRVDGLQRFAGERLEVGVAFARVPVVLLPTAGLAAGGVAVAAGAVGYGGGCGLAHVSLHSRHSRG
jgi:hypothetical protein